MLPDDPMTVFWNGYSRDHPETRSVVVIRRPQCRHSRRRMIFPPRMARV